MVIYKRQVGSIGSLSANLYSTVRKLYVSGNAFR